MKITLRLFASARELCGFSTRDIDLTAPTLNAVTEYLSSLNPSFRDISRACRFAVNREYAQGPVTLADGDEVTVIPPVSGG
jgi:molybdopterin converting factor subunit 1